MTFKNQRFWDNISNDCITHAIANIVGVGINIGILDNEAKVKINQQQQEFFKNKEMVKQLMMGDSTKY